GRVDRGRRGRRRQRTALAHERAVVRTRFVRLARGGARLADAVTADGGVLLACGATARGLHRTVVGAAAARLVRLAQPVTADCRLADALAVIDRADLVRERTRLRRRTHLRRALQAPRVEAGGAGRRRRHHAALADERAVVWTRFVRLAGRGARLTDAVAAGGGVGDAGGTAARRLDRTIVRAVASILVTLAAIVTADRGRADPL